MDGDLIIFLCFAPFGFIRILSRNLKVKLWAAWCASIVFICAIGMALYRKSGSDLFWYGLNVALWMWIIFGENKDAKD